MVYVTPVEFVRIYNQVPLKELCAEVIKHNYLSNTKAVLEREFVEELSPSELSYLNGKNKERLLPVILHTLSMSSTTFGPLSSDVLGKYVHSRILQLLVIII